MQSLGAVTSAQLKASVQAPLLKLEIYYGGAWVNLCSLGGVNYLKDISLSLGGATMTPAPVAGSWSATIHNANGAFLPANTSGAYKDYLVTGRKVRISTGGTYGGSDVYWVRMVGVMDSPEFSIFPPEVKLRGFDYAQYLADYKLRSPNNYWGNSTTISTSGPTESLGAEIYAEADACEIGAGEANNVTNWSATTAVLSSVADVGGGSTYVLKALFGSGATTLTYSTAGVYNWTCPAGVTSLSVACWGGGGGGGFGGTAAGSGGDGGGGGAYSIKTVTVTPGTTYVITVGAGGASDTEGGDSWFGSTVTVLAKGGQYGQHDGGSGPAGAGGAAASGVGDTKYSGGDGGGRADNGGGGGAGSAGTGANGNNGSAASGDSGGAAGGAVAGGGAGGAGGDLDTNGFDGSAPGGAGGGAGRGSVTYKIGGSGAAGKVVLSYTGAASTDSVINSNVGAVTAATTYKVVFKYKIVTGPGTLAGRAYIGSARQDGEASGLTSSSYATATFYFTASESGDLQLQFDITGAASGTDIRIDEISVKPVTAIVYVRNYDLPDECTGVYYATLDGAAIWYGEDPDGWFYDATHNGFVFHENKNVEAGTDNLVVYYHTAQLPEYVVADILVSVGLYATRVTALAAMTYTETGTVIDRVWFEAGTTALNAIRMICERVNYRFYFKYDGTPVFIPPPTIAAAGAESETFEPHIHSGPVYYEDTAELFNVIAISGEKIAQPLGTEQTMESNYKDTDSDSTSITAYGDRTKSISNHLFQSDAICSTLAASYLAAYKDPKKYLGFTLDFNAIPLELGDTLSVDLKVSPDMGYGGLYDLFFYDDGTLYDTEGTTVTVRGLVRDIKLANANATYRLELE
jgi:hypothetical protein